MIELRKNAAVLTCCKKPTERKNIPSAWIASLWLKDLHLAPSHGTAVGKRSNAPLTGSVTDTDRTLRFL